MGAIFFASPPHLAIELSSLEGAHPHRVQTLRQACVAIFLYPHGPHFLPWSFSFCFLFISMMASPVTSIRKS